MNVKRHLRTLVLSVGILLAGWRSAYADGYVFGEGKPEWSIYLEASAPDSVQLAAKDLSEYIHRVTGSPVSLTSSSDNLTARTIYLGDTPFAREHKIDTCKFPSDGFRILTTQNGIFIAGKDYSGNPQTGLDNPYRINETYNGKHKISAFGDAGTLQGTYYFLRQYFGVRWYMPGNLGEVVPPVTPITVPSIDLEKTPAFSYRYPYLCHFADADEEALWYRRAGFGAPFPVEINHSFDRFLKYKDSHPEYFALIDGQRDFTTLSSMSGPGNLNLSDPGLLKAVINDINEYFDQNPSRMLYPLSPPDGMTRISEDPASQSQIDLSMGERGKFSNYVWGFINKVAAGVREKHPDKMIGCIAYEHYNDPPNNIDKMDPNVVVMICKQRRVFPDEKYEQYIQQIITRWRAKAETIYTWEYYCDVLFNAGWRGYPVFYPSTVQRDLKFLRGKVNGEMIEAESWTPDQASDPQKTIINYPGLQHPLLYFTARLLWDPDTNIQETIDEYYQKFYGPGEKEMRAFWETTEKAWTGKSGLNPSDVYSREVTQKLLEHLDAAINATEDNSIYRKRIELIKSEFAPAAGKASRLAGMVKPETLVVRFSNDQPVTAKLENSFWETGIPVLSLIDTSYKKASPATHVRLAWTEKALKISMVCFEPDMDKTVTTTLSEKPMKDPPIWNDDSVEIFLKPANSEPKRCYQFIINSNGAVYDAKNTTDSWATSTPAWTSSADVVVKRQNRRWTVEMSIPWSSLDLEAPKTGDVLLGNFYRNRYTSGERQEFSWAPIVQGLYFAPNDFGRIIFGD